MISLSAFPYNAARHRGRDPPWPMGIDWSYASSLLVSDGYFEARQTASEHGVSGGELLGLFYEVWPLYLMLLGRPSIFEDLRTYL